MRWAERKKILKSWKIGGMAEIVSRNTAKTGAGSHSIVTAAVAAIATGPKLGKKFSSLGRVESWSPVTVTGRKLLFLPQSRWWHNGCWHKKIARGFAVWTRGDRRALVAIRENGSCSLSLWKLTLHRVRQGRTYNWKKLISDHHFDKTRPGK